MPPPPELLSSRNPKGSVVEIVTQGGREKRTRRKRKRKGKGDEEEEKVKRGRGDGGGRRGRGRVWRIREKRREGDVGRRGGGLCMKD